MNRNLFNAQEAYRSGDYEAALHFAQLHLFDHDSDGRAWEILGLTQFAQGAFVDSVASLEQATSLVPLTKAARVCLAQGYARTGRNSLATDLLTDLILDKSLPIPLLLQVANGLDFLDHPGLSIRACRAALQQDPEQAQVYYDLGYYSIRCGYPPQVTESLVRKAISLAPENICYRVGRAMFLMKQGRDDEAHAVFRALSDEQLDRIACLRCVGHIVEFLQARGDDIRAESLRRRLSRVNSSLTEFSSDAELG